MELGLPALFPNEGKLEGFFFFSLNLGPNLAQGLLCWAWVCGWSCPFCSTLGTVLSDCSI